ncbi:MAG TPA: PAS domain-containing protein [Terriglobales bacterium]|nr:PAS domain-containing protein [Terriglobales bacterium]
MTTRDEENELLRSVALQNATTILTARRRAERRNEAYLAEAQRLSHTGSFGWTPCTGVIYWSDETFRIFQYDRTTTPTVELILQRVHPEDAALVRQTIERASQDGKDFDSEHRLVMPDGSVKHVHVVAHASSDESGSVEFVGAVMDVSDRKRAEERLHAAMSERMRLTAFRAEIGMVLAHEENLRGTLHKCAEAIVRHLDAAFARVWTLSSDGRELQLQASAGMYTRLDGSHSRIPVGQLKIGLIAQERKTHLTNNVQNDPRVNDKEWARREKMISFAGYPLLVEDRVVGVMGMFSQKPLSESTLEALSFISDGMAQVIDRKRAEEALRRSQGYLAEAQRLAHIGAWVWEVAGGNASYLADEWYRIYGFDPRDGLPTWDERLQRVHPDDRATWKSVIDRAVADKTDYEVDYRILVPRIGVKHIRAVGHPVCNPAGELVQFVGVSMDITERKQAEDERERLRQLQSELAHINRVTTMGELAASIAHEIKQPISAAHTNAKTCLRWLGRDQPDIAEAREAVSRITQDVTRASEIISRISILFKKGEPQQEWVDVNEVIREMINLLRSEAGRRAISIRTELAPDLPHVNADRVQLQQVFMNLMLNGIDAISERNAAGDLTIKSRRNADDQVLISVTDTGIGLPPERADKVFDAFFTTKRQGTGMGLSISRSIIESHGGRLWATANSDRGATFQFTLPVEHAAAA